MEVVAQKEVIAQQKHELVSSLAGFPRFHTNHEFSTRIALATLDPQHYIQNVFKLLISHPKFLALYFTASV